VVGFVEYADGFVVFFEPTLLRLLSAFVESQLCILVYYKLLLACWGRGVENGSV
jgi:hypothetical protein